MPYATVNHLRLHYLSDGPATSASRGDAVLLLHGFARSGWFWRDWVPAFADRYRVVRPDIRGCGRSSDPKRPFRLADVADDVIGLVDALGIDQVHLVGESTGGMAGVVVAHDHPERFKSLTLISTPLSPSRGDDRVMSPEAASPTESMRKLGLARWWIRSRGITNDLFGDERDEEAAQEFARTPLHIAIDMWEAMHDPALTLEPYLADLRVPVLVLTPTSSLTVSTHDQAELVRAVPGSRQIVYADQPHFVFLLDPDRLAGDCRAFLDSIDNEAP
jgi:pimeloyl-ACP methyl ester carboxylesterase